MNSTQLIQYFDQVVAQMRDTLVKKNADYSGDVADTFANFKMVEHFGAASVEQGFFTRLTDKFSRIASFIKKGILHVKDETVKDTLLDLAIYCILVSAYLESKKGETHD